MYPSVLDQYEARIAELMQIIKHRNERIAELEAGMAEVENEICRKTYLADEWPPESTAIISEYDVALRADAGTPWPTDEQMVKALRSQDYVVLTNVEIDSLHYAGGECPVCGQQVQP